MVRFNHAAAVRMYTRLVKAGRQDAGRSTGGIPRGGAAEPSRPVVLSKKA